MKTRFLKSFVCLMLVCALAFAMTGCEDLDYRDAVDLYNAAMVVAGHIDSFCSAVQADVTVGDDRAAKFELPIRIIAGGVT